MGPPPHPPSFAKVHGRYRSDKKIRKKFFKILAMFGSVRIRGFHQTIHSWVCTDVCVFARASEITPHFLTTNIKLNKQPNPNPNFTRQFCLTGSEFEEPGPHPKLRVPFIQTASTTKRIWFSGCFLVKTYPQIFRCHLQDWCRLGNV